MNLVDQSILPFVNLSNILIKNNNLSKTGLEGNGCISDCVPFLCHNGQEIKNFVFEKSSGQAAFEVIELLIMRSTPLNYIKVFFNWLNKTINSKKIQENTVKALESRLKGLSNQILLHLHCRLPWCDTISEIENAPVFSTNLDFGEKGPELAQEFVRLYVTAAKILNNDRFGKTTQKILDIKPYEWDLIDDDLPDNYKIYKGTMMIKVPNIEHFWMDDQVILPDGKSIKVKNRSGKSNETTEDCARVWGDVRIFPNGLYEKGRGCSVADGSLGASKSGINIKNLTGEGWLMTEGLNVSEYYTKMIGKTLSLKNPVFIDEKGQVFTNSKPAAAVKLIEPKANTASFGNIASAIILAGIGIGLFYEANK